MANSLSTSIHHCINWRNTGFKAKRVLSKEIPRCIPNLKDNLHYVTFLRVIPKLGIIEVKSKRQKISSTESTKNENFVNENHVTENDDKLSENAKRNLEKLTNRKPKFSYDHSTKGRLLLIKEIEMTKRTINIIAQGKGGVGKTFVSTQIAQYYSDSEVESLNIDTDPVNSTFSIFWKTECKTYWFAHR